MGDRYKESDLFTQEIFNLIEDPRKHISKLHISSSEPFFREDFLSVLRYQNKYKCKVSFATNETLLIHKRLDTLAELGVEEVIFSIDGDEDLHDTIRGKEVFKKVSKEIILS